MTNMCLHKNATFFLICIHLAVKTLLLLLWLRSPSTRLSSAPHRPLRSPLQCDKDVAVLVKRSRRLIREEFRSEKTNGVAEGGFKEIKTLPTFIKLVNNVCFKDLPQIRTKRQPARVKSATDGNLIEKRKKGN